MEDIKKILTYDNHFEMNNVTIENCIINFEENGFVSAQDTVFDNCEIILNISAKYLMFTDVSFNSCRIRAKKQISNFIFSSCFFVKCDFYGKYSGCTFGNFYDRGSVLSCNFHEAMFLSISDFYLDSGLESIVWPKWPIISILEPAKNKKLLTSIDFPEEFKKTLNVHILFENKAVAVLFNLKESSLNPEIIWALIQDLDFIVFSGKNEKEKIDEKNVLEFKKQIQDELLEIQEKQKSQKKYKIWKYLDHHVSISNIIKRKNEIVISIDNSSIYKKVEYAPEIFQIKLLNVNYCYLKKDSKETEIVKWGDNFRIMSANIINDEVVLGGHRKNLGKIHLSYKDIVITDSIGTIYTFEDVLNFIELYNNNEYVPASIDQNELMNIDSLDDTDEPIFFKNFVIIFLIIAVAIFVKIIFF